MPDGVGKTDEPSSARPGPQVAPLEMLGTEFLATQLPGAARIELHSGPVGATVARVCERDGADLVVLSWAQDSSPGRAAVIREVLGHSVVPVLLLPVHDFEEPASHRSTLTTAGGS